MRKCLRDVAIVGIGQLPVEKESPLSLRQMGAAVIHQALAAANRNEVDAVYLSNMLSDELQGQKHLAALVADEAGLAGVEALQIRAATAAAAGALRVGVLAVASGAVDSCVVVGVEKMSSAPPTPVLAKALDAEREVPDGATLLSQNARCMALYQERYRPPADAFAHFAVNAHANARHNPNALFRDKEVTVETVMSSRVIVPPIRLYDCSPICDGAAAVVLVPEEDVGSGTVPPVRVLASAAATDRFRLADRPNPLDMPAARQAIIEAFEQADIRRADVDFYELHDAFTIMACLLLEAAGFAPLGEGWRLAAEGRIALDGDMPIATMGGLKARGHPVGATALYQTCEIVQQLTGCAGANQLLSPRIAMLQSIGGAGTTALTHIFGVANR